MIQSFQKYLYPFLSLMGDGKVRDISQVSDDLGKTMNLTEIGRASCRERV